MDNSRPSASRRLNGRKGWERIASRMSSATIFSFRGVDDLLAGATESGDREDYRVQLLEIPEFGEIKADRGGIVQAAGLHTLDEPRQPLIHRRFRRWSRLQQHLDGEGCFLDAR